MQRQAVSKRSQSSMANDSAYHEALLNRSAKHGRNDFDRYIEIPNDAEIVDSLGWWRENQINYPNLARMARDTLSVVASGCTVERVFSISGRLSVWQRNQLNAETISHTMLDKYAIAKTNNPVFMDDLTKDGDLDMYPVLEKEGTIPEEWVQHWWCAKLDKVPVGKVSLDKMFPPSELLDLEEDEDIYG
jgi:hypothetical protein